MPYDMWGNFIDHTRAPNDQQQAAAAQAQAAAAQAQATIVAQMQQGYIAGAATQYGGFYQTRDVPMYEYILNLGGQIEGLKEVKVSMAAFLNMCAELNTPGGNSLILATPYGRVTVRPEGAPTQEQMDFDRYMEDVDARLP